MKRRNEQLRLGLAVAYCWVSVIACGKTVDATNAAQGGGAGDSASVADSGAATAIAGANATNASGGASARGGATASGGATANGGASARGGANASGGASHAAGASGNAGSGSPSPPLAALQFGDIGENDALQVGVDADENIYVGGETQSALKGPLNGLWDIFLRKYDVNLNVLWTLQWGKDDYNTFSALAVEASGNVYVAGYDDTVFPGTAAANRYLNKYDSSGTLLRTQATPAEINALTLDTSDNLYVLSHSAASSASSSITATLSKFDASGASLWVTPFGLPDVESAVEIALDPAGKIYVASNRLSPDDASKSTAMLYQFDASGTLLRSSQYVSASDHVASVAVDASGNVFVAGDTPETAPDSIVGARDAFIRKYTPGGLVSWSQQFGSGVNDFIYSVRIDALGNPYVAGRTFGVVGPPDDPTSAFVRKYDTDGKEQWNTYGSASSSNRIVSLAIAKSGNVYGVGSSDSSAMLVKLVAP